MKLTSPLLFLLLLLLPCSTNAIFDWFTTFFSNALQTMCHSRYNPFYWLVFLPLGFGGGYPNVFEIARIGDEGTVRHWGTCIRAAIDSADVSALLPTMVQKVSDGTAFRVNNLGMIRLDESVFPCGSGAATPYSNGYCGIGLGMPSVDKVKIREFFDIALGGGATGVGTWSESGNSWTYAGIRADAVAFLSTREVINSAEDAGAFYIQQIHKIALGINISIEEAKEFYLYGLRVNIAALVPPIPFISLIGIDAGAAREGRAQYITLYESAIRGRLAEFKLEESSVTLAANAFLDAVLFAASPSISGVTKGVIGVYLTDLDPAVDWSNIMDLKSVIMEEVRWAPPVLGVPFQEDGIRYHSVVGYTGYDKTVWGEDALTFRVRGDVEYYRARTLNWSDAALPLEGRPETAFICPARSLSFNLVLAFLDALDIESWTVQGGGSPPKVPKAGRGPGFWKNSILERI